MNKQQKLVQSLIRQAVRAGGMVFLFGALYLGASYLEEDTHQDKEAADIALNRDRGEINTLSNQLDKSGIAEKQFLATQNSRVSTDFSPNTEELKNWLRNAKSQFRLSNGFKLSLTAEKIADNKEIASMNYEVVEHPGMRLEFSAMSDTHVFSFLNELERNSPGFIRVESLSLRRQGEVDKSTIGQLRAGITPYLIEAKIEFNWVGLREKQTKEAAPAVGGVK